MDESQDDNTSQDPRSEQDPNYNSYARTTGNEGQYMDYLATTQQEEQTGMMDTDLDTAPQRKADLGSDSRRNTGNDGPSKKKTRDSSHQEDADGQTNGLSSEMDSQTETGDNDTVQSIQIPLKTLIIDENAAQEAQGDAMADLPHTHPTKVSGAAVEARLQTPAWMGEVVLPSTPPIRLRLRDPTAWAQLVTGWLTDSLIKEEIATKAKFEAQIILAEQLSESLPEGNWSGYTTLYHAQRASGGMPIEEAKVDLSNQRHRHDLRIFLARLQGHEDGHEKIEYVRAMLAKDGILPEPLPQWAQFNMKGGFIYNEVVPISWWTQQKGYATLTGMSNGRDGFPLSIDDADFMMGTAKIGIANGMHHLISRTTLFGDSVLQVAMRKIEVMGRRFLAEATNPPPPLSTTNMRSWSAYA